MVLTMCVAALLIACIMSISSPARFERRVAERERIVKTRLLHIRSAAERYRSYTNNYPHSLQTLVNNGYMADSLQYIPFTNHRRFSFIADHITTATGRKIPVMECGATYADYLNGLDRSAIRNLINTAENNGSYPGLRFGDITENIDNKANWEK